MACRTSPQLPAPPTTMMPCLPHWIVSPTPCLHPLHPACAPTCPHQLYLASVQQQRGPHTNNASVQCMDPELQAVLSQPSRYFVVIEGQHHLCCAGYVHCHPRPPASAHVQNPPCESPACLHTLPPSHTPAVKPPTIIGPQHSPWAHSRIGALGRRRDACGGVRIARAHELKERAVTRAVHLQTGGQAGRQAGRQAENLVEDVELDGQHNGRAG